VALIVRHKGDWKIARVNTRTGETVFIGENAKTNGLLLQWNANGKLYRQGLQMEGKDVQFNVSEVDSSTGAERKIYSAEVPTNGSPTLSPDARTLFVLRSLSKQTLGSQPPAGPFDLIAHDMQTGMEKALTRLNNGAVLSVSPDGRYIAASSPDETILIPSVGGNTTEFPGISLEVWFTDSRLFIGRKEPANPEVNKKKTYWWTPIDKSQPRELDLHISSDEASKLIVQGNRIAFGDEFRQPRQVSVIENFLTPATAKR